MHKGSPQIVCILQNKAPGCNAKIILGRYQDPLQPCPFRPVQCSKEKCPEPVLSKGLQEHLSVYCRFPGGKCLIAKRMWQSSVYRIMRKSCVLGTQYLVPTNVCRLFQELRWMNPWPCVLKLNETVLLRAVDVLQRINGGTCRTMNVQPCRTTGFWSHLEKNFQLEEKISNLYIKRKQNPAASKNCKEIWKWFQAVYTVVGQKWKLSLKYACSCQSHWQVHLPRSSGASVITNG